MPQITIYNSLLPLLHLLPRYTFRLHNYSTITRSTPQKTYHVKRIASVLHCLVLFRWNHKSFTLFLQETKVMLGRRPPIVYDLLSIDVGITPAASAVPGALKYSTPVKPISTCALQPNHPRIISFSLKSADTSVCPTST